jgi:hypothetical protein
VPASNGTCPVTISYNTTPSAYTFGAGIDRQPERLLRCHVRGRADDEPLLGELEVLLTGDQLGDTKVSEQRPGRRRHQDVGGFHVPMHDALLVGVVQRVEYVCSQPDRGWRVHRRAERVGEGGAGVDVLRDEVDVAVLLAIVIDWEDIGVRQSGKRSRLQLEARHEMRIRDTVKDFHRDETSE